MKSVLISIQPKWVEKIASGEKTIEVRKTRPKIETPFKCYIYCTKDNKTAFNNHNGNMFLSPKGWQDYSECNGKVIGEFVCDRIDEYAPALFNGQNFYQNFGIGEEIKTCLSEKELIEYGKDKKLYAWHISNLKIYDKPKSLEMFPVGKIARDCGCGGYIVYDKVLTRPPQSWCYVESLGVE